MLGRAKGDGRGKEKGPRSLATNWTVTVLPSLFHSVFVHGLLLLPLFSRFVLPIQYEYANEEVPRHRCAILRRHTMGKPYQTVPLRIRASCAEFCSLTISGSHRSNLVPVFYGSRLKGRRNLFSLSIYLIVIALH